jgi:lactoylglutathione lyase
VVSGISVIYLYVSDLERSLGFYRDLLGLPLAAEDGDWAEAPLPSGLRFALHTAHGDEQLGSGTVRINLEVDDVDAEADRLRRAGVSVGDVIREDWGSACEIVDPDGYRLELYEPPS